MKTLSLLILLISFNAFAQKAELTVVDPEIDASELRENFNVHYGSTHTSSLPSRDEREAFFEGFSKIEKWDELKKDIFYMDLKSKPVSDLVKRYPDLSASEIKKLQGKRR